jgi:hypothetical protein
MEPKPKPRSFETIPFAMGIWRGVRDIIKASPMSHLEVTDRERTVTGVRREPATSRVLPLAGNRGRLVFYHVLEDSQPGLTEEQIAAAKISAIAVELRPQERGEPYMEMHYVVNSKGEISKRGTVVYPKGTSYFFTNEPTEKMDPDFVRPEPRIEFPELNLLWSLPRVANRSIVALSLPRLPIDTKMGENPPKKSE